MTNEEMAADICGRLCESKDSEEYNAMYHACIKAIEWKDEQAVQDRVLIRKHWQRWAEEREEEMKNNIESIMFNVFYKKGLLLLESVIHEITYELTKKTNS
ncbi:MAG: hypothetical protein J5767_12590 [Paludibacteraceae bacterium]|nr:hypothetical protein [Paludibacteraceae bacterium]